MTGQTPGSLSIGQLAAQSGLTIRTLHHYDRLGLLRASDRDQSGYRRYGERAVERLYRIRALKSLGLSLADIGAVLDRSDTGDGLAQVVEAQLRHVRDQQMRLRELERDLGLVLDALGGTGATDRAQLLSMIGGMNMLQNTLRHDYSQQAPRYDSSRGVSQDVLTAVTAAIDGAPGRALVDVGGGTGNYALALRVAGWSPTVVDASAQMRAAAEDKGLIAIAGEATRLPLADESVDAVTMISMLHQVGDWRRALAEARRVLRPSGRLAVMGLAAEHLREVTWVYDLFPSMREFALSRRPSLVEMTAELPGAQITPMWFTDLSDASIGALCAHPTAMLDPQCRQQTSFFERLTRDHPQELEDGLRTLQAWIDTGQDPRQSRRAARERLGDASIIAWHKA